MAQLHDRYMMMMIKMDLQGLGWGGMDWIDLAQDTNRWRALVNDIMNLRVAQSAGNFLIS